MVWPIVFLVASGTTNPAESGVLHNCYKIIQVVEEYSHPLCTPTGPGEVGSLFISTRPNHKVVYILLQGSEKGFQIAFDYTQAKLKRKRSNLLSTSVNQEVVATYIE